MNDSLIPSGDLQLASSKNKFLNSGKTRFDQLIRLGGLLPNHKVLDVGCGTGRIAIHLTEYMDSNSEYHGLDIIKSSIDWCQNAYKLDYPNFHFHHSDVFNSHFNPHGKIQSTDYSFPFEDEYFDFVFLLSVFTHMEYTDLKKYLSEISRVLKNGGKAYITFFILNRESMTNLLVNANNPKLHKLNRFFHKVDGGLTSDKNNPDLAVAYYEEVIRELYSKFNLKIQEPIRYANWSQMLGGQDTVIACKNS